MSLVKVASSIHHLFMVKKVSVIKHVVAKKLSQSPCLPNLLQEPFQSTSIHHSYKQYNSLKDQQESMISKQHKTMTSCTSYVIR